MCVPEILLVKCGAALSYSSLRSPPIEVPGGRWLVMSITYSVFWQFLCIWPCFLLVTLGNYLTFPVFSTEKQPNNSTALLGILVKLYWKKHVKYLTYFLEYGPQQNMSHLSFSFPLSPFSWLPLLLTLWPFLLIGSSSVILFRKEAYVTQSGWKVKRNGLGTLT